MLGRKGESPARMGSEKALSTAVRAVHLQSTINQMTQYGALLKPIFGTMEEAEADLIVNGGFPKIETVKVPASEPGAEGPVLPPLQDDQRRQMADAGSPMRATMASPGATAGSTLALANPSEAEGSKPTKHPKAKSGVSKKPYASRIPWTLLDELEAEKHKLVTEQVNRLPFERRARKGMSLSPGNPLVLNPKEAKSMSKKEPVHPEWPQLSGGLEIE